jgi:phage I-like protein
VDRSEAAEMIRQLPKDAQATALELLIEATAADGRIAPEEKAYLEAVGAEMGISGAEIEKRVTDKLS